jgi:carboxymethylenebutenolidase
MHTNQNFLPMRRIVVFIFLLANFAVINAQDVAIRQLNESPRHHEWVKVENDGREINCFVVYPEISEKATVVIVIHENRGLTDWVRSFSDRLAAKGYITVAPDLLSEFSEEYPSTSDFPNSDAARNAIYELPPDQVKYDLMSVQDYAEQLPAGNGKTVVAGFCWGGSQSFRMATYNSDIKAALVFYGSAPEKKEIKNISAPVYGFYGGNDERINSGIPETEKQMQAEGKKYNYFIYPGAGHAYMRNGADPSGSAENIKAREKSWEKMLEILGEI